MLPRWDPAGPRPTMFVPVGLSSEQAEALANEHSPSPDGGMYRVTEDQANIVWLESDEAGDA